MIAGFSISFEVGGESAGADREDAADFSFYLLVLSNIANKLVGKFMSSR